jgi:hypothetical protein
MILWPACVCGCEEGDRPRPSEFTMGAPQRVVSPELAAFRKDQDPGMRPRPSTPPRPQRPN